MTLLPRPCPSLARTFWGVERISGTGRKFFWSSGWFKGLSWGTILGFGVACAGAPLRNSASGAPLEPPQAEAWKNPSAPEEMSGKGGGHGLPELTTYPLLAQGLSVELPGENFSREQTHNGWSFVEDKSRGISLWARITVERRSVSLAECEDRATGALSILRKQRSALKKASTFQTQHFFGALWGLGPEMSGETQEGLWVVHAVSTARCLSAVYAVAPSPDTALWLTLGREFVLPSLRLAVVQDRVIEANPAR